MADEQGFKFEDDDPSWCRTCRLFMMFLCMSGTEQVWFEDWKCLKCGDIVQIEVTPKSSEGFIDDLLLD